MEISVIVTSYNYDLYIETCLRSLINQSFNKEKYEIIVVDDCSTDNTKKIFDYFKDIKNVRIFRNKKNLGVAESSNIGIRAALGKYIVRVDADDYVNEEFLYQLHLFYRYNSQAFGVACDYIYVNNNGNKLKRVSAKEVPVSCGIMYSKDKLVKNGLYKRSWRHREEEELRKRIGKDYKIEYLSMPLYRYRMHKSNKTKQLNNMRSFKEKLSKSLRFKKSAGHTVVVIPARKNSKRLKNKNKTLLWGEPLISWSIKAAMNAEYVDAVFVSSDCHTILEIAKGLGASVIKRPASLSLNSIPKQKVIEHAIKYLEKKKSLKAKVVVSLQPNSPEVTSQDINNCIELLVKNKNNEVMSVDENGKQNAAIRVMKYETVFDKKLSTYFQVYTKNIIDVHTYQDIQILENRNHISKDVEEI